MKKFDIILCSFRQVREFVALARRQSFEITAGNERQNINGKDLVGMFSLDYSRPVQITAVCSEEEFSRFRTLATQIPT